MDAEVEAMLVRGEAVSTTMKSTLHLISDWPPRTHATGIPTYEAIPIE